MRILIFSIVLCTSTLLSAQLPANPIGSNLLRTKWSAVDGEGAKVIYPQGLDSVGVRISQLINTRLASDRSDIGTHICRVPLLVHPYQVRANAFVTPGPFRSEFYAVSPQYKNMLHWLDELTLHEYRHVEQFANADKGITKLVGNVFGSWARGGMMATVLPRWYFEGDAVIAETALSSQGRGRFPEFLQEYHALLDDDIIYDYEKAAAGSLKDFVPSWYHLGYHMLSHGREQYGPNVWADVRDDAVRYKGLVYPFGRSVKKHTGRTVKDLYYDTMADLQKEWKSYDASTQSTATLLSPESKSTVVNYSCPLPQSDGSVIAIKYGYDQFYTLIRLLPDGSEECLTGMGLLLDQSLATLSQQGNKVLWAEQGFHHRRSNVTYSDLYTYDIASGTKRRLTHGHRYFSPTYSPDGRQIAVIVTYEDLSQGISILDAQSAEVTQEFSMPLFTEISYPVWINDEHIAYIRTSDQQNHIEVIDISKKSIKQLTDPSFSHRSHLSYADGDIYFAQQDGWTNQIYSISAQGDNLTKHTRAKMGAYQPVVANGDLYYASFSREGYDVFKTKLVDLPTPKAAKSPMYSSMLSQPTSTDIVSSMRTSAHPEHKSHSRWSGLLNPHSLIPNWADPELSLTLLSDNVLGTLSADATATYNYNENTMSYSGGLTYAELYPELSARYGHSDRGSAFFSFSTPNDTTLYQDIYVQNWDEKRLSGGISIPYVFSRGPMSNRLNLSANYTRAKIDLVDEKLTEISRDTISIRPEALPRLQPIIIDRLSDQTLHLIDLRAQLSMFRYRARQNLNPRFGLYLEGRYRANLETTTTDEASLLLRGDLYLPGLKKNHSTYIQTMYQSENLLSNYRFSDRFVYPRGYNNSLRRDRFYKVGFNYSFPLAYPDLAIGGLAFWKRLSANVFYDIGRVDIAQFPFSPSRTYFNSTGVELGFDVRLLRLLEANFRVRYSYLLNKDFAPGGQQHQFDFFVISLRAQ